EAEIGIHDEVGAEGIDAGKGEAMRLPLSRARIGAIDRAPLQGLAEHCLIDGEEIENAITPPDIEFVVDVPVDLAVNRPAVKQKARRGKVVIQTVGIPQKIGRRYERQNLFDNRTDALRADDVLHAIATDDLAACPLRIAGQRIVNIDRVLGTVQQIPEI